jgi:hypothetical protein
MSIQIPAELHEVAYLVGKRWPEGDEDGMYEIGRILQKFSEQLSALIPALNRIRARTLEVLRGQTATAADSQFKLLFDGSASVHKLATAMGALADLAMVAAKGIVHTKLSILTSLAIAAFEIAWARAQTAATFGASEAEIPIIEISTIAAIRRTVTRHMNEIMVKSAKVMTKTNVRRIAKKSAVKTGEGVGQELFIEAVQGDLNLKQVKKVALANATGGAAPGAVSVVGKRMLKGASMSPVLQGELISYGSGVAKQVVGSVATGEKIDPVSLVGSPIKSAVTGGIRGGGGTTTVSTATASDSEESE